MKKYIAPVAKTISLDVQESMLLTQSDNYGDGDQLSNRREYHSVSEDIWGTGTDDDPISFF